MATYIVSDIHGEFVKFKQALTKIKFSKSDTLFILGDMIDRGFDSKGVLDLIIRMLDDGYNVNCILGNHEKMFVEARNDFSTHMKWLKNGGDQTLASFLTSNLENVPEHYFDFINSLPTYIEYDKFILVHAGINMKLENPFEDQHSMLWLRDWEKYFDEQWLSGRTIIHGHTPQIQHDIEYQILNKKGVIGIDNGSFLSKDGFGGICILQLDNMSIHFQN